MDNGWTEVHDLALLYVACAYRGDKEMDDEERKDVLAMLSRRFPRLSEAEAESVLGEATLSYLSSAGKGLLSAAVITLGDILSPSDRKEVVRELSGIASSDGLIYPAEANFIARVARTWRVEGPPTDS